MTSKRAPGTTSFPPEIASATGEMADRVRAFDWAATPLGPMRTWPEALKLALGICLNSRFPMFVWWGPHYINIYNDAYVPMLGERHPRALGRPARDSWDDIWDIVGAQADAVTKRGEATWNERVKLVMHRHGYAEDTWFTWSYSPIYDQQGDICGMFCAVTEETGRVKAEAERDAFLDRAVSDGARLSEAFAHSPSFLAVLEGPQHRFAFANDRYLQLVGRRPIIGRTLVEALPEVVDQGFVTILDRVFASAEPFVGTGVRVSLQREAGAPPQDRHLDFVYQPMRGPGGEVTGVLVHGIDITDRHNEAMELARIERVVRESESRFRQLADAMPQIVFTAQADGTVDYFNKRWYEYTGLPDGDSGVDSWQRVHTEDGIRRVMEAWPRALRTGEPYEIEYPLRRHDGVYRWHLGRALPIRDANGTIVRWFGTNTDIHDWKQIQERLHQSLEAEQHARSEAELASRMKDEFLATLSHELRTPLNAILGWAHMLRQDVSPKQLAHGADVIERNARAQSRIIEDLLDMSAIISGKIRLDIEVLDPEAFVSAAVENAKPAAEAKGIAIDAGFEAAGGARLLADGNRLQQVLWNLLSNAVKFTPPKGRVAVRMAKAGDSHLDISVTDTGEGIAAEFLPYVFDRFRQADASTTRRHGGLGLGLAIVKQLVELHGGSVHVASPGRGLGATFTVRLPLAAADSAQGPGEPARRAAPAKGTDAVDRSSLAGMRVLVVDDDSDARDLVKRLLEEYDAEVTVASNGAQALDLLQRLSFDALVSDIGMPGQDGHELIRAVRELSPARGGSIPAIALTAYARPEDRQKSMRAGFQVHIAKPVDPAELIALLKSLAHSAR